jgi:Leucyl/phenylalanyl-tRNA protein transferase
MSTTWSPFAKRQKIPQGPRPCGSGNDPLAPPETALAEPNGLLCAGADLSPERIAGAYRKGIFPWFSRGEPVLWWSPDPRMVLVPAEIRITRSLGKTLRLGRYTIRLDSAFPEVIRACASTPRPGQKGTWITRDMQSAYTRLFELGVAHSVETGSPVVSTDWPSAGCSTGNPCFRTPLMHRKSPSPTLPVFLAHATSV